MPIMNKYNVGDVVKVDEGEEYTVTKLPGHSRTFPTCYSGRHSVDGGNGLFKESEVVELVAESRENPAISKYEFRGTPGNWYPAEEQVSPGSNATCYTVVTDEFDVVSPLLGIRRKQDAQAISAVPDLIEALNDCVALFRNGDLMAEDCGPEYRAACAALAKATGATT